MWNGFGFAKETIRLNQYCVVRGQRTTRTNFVENGAPRQRTTAENRPGLFHIYQCGTALSCSSLINVEQMDGGAGFYFISG
jgi:hypothetical protein